MKKAVVFVCFAFLSSISLSSCVNEYICQCKISSTGSPGLPEPVVNEYLIKDNKKTAKDLCEKASAEYTDPDSGITTTEKCALF